MIQKYNTNNYTKLFIIFIFLIIAAFFSVNDAKAQFFPPPSNFPFYTYFNPLFNPFPGVSFPISAPAVFPLAPTLPSIPYPTASIQGTTIYVPATATNLKLTGPGLGPLLTGILPPATIFIYPSGYVPPAPVGTTIIAPTVASPTVVTPTIVVPPATVTPTTALPVTTAIPATTTVPAAVSGFGLLWFNNPFTFWFPF